MGEPPTARLRDLDRLQNERALSLWLHRGTSPGVDAAALTAGATAQGGTRASGLGTNPLTQASVLGISVTDQGFEP